jgi:glucose-6-phosphate dehydrogenase assembly protein OpcA
VEAAVSIGVGRGGSADDLIWSERGTTPDRIEVALRELLRERYASNQQLAPARVLNLVVVLDRAWKGEISNRLSQVGRYQASRTVVCAVEEGRTDLDAMAVMAYDKRTPGGIGVMYESIEIEMGPSHLPHLDTIIDQVIVSEIPTVLWSPHGHDEALQALLGMVDVVLLDSDQLLEPAESLAHTAALLDSAYVVDLAWLRTVPWRERLAASFDPLDRRARLHELESLSVRYKPSSTASALLMAGWLTSRLHLEPGQLHSANGDGLRGAARGESGEIQISLEPSEQESPGLVGVTVGCCEQYSLSLDRGKGGLTAREHTGDGERSWQVLGASRGEGGILGEGVRQALLRDPTYGPALEAARRFSP